MFIRLIYTDHNVEVPLENPAVDDVLAHVRDHLEELAPGSDLLSIVVTDKPRESSDFNIYELDDEALAEAIDKISSMGIMLDTDVASGLLRAYFEAAAAKRAQR